MESNVSPETMSHAYSNRVARRSDPANQGMREKTSLFVHVQSASIEADFEID